LVLVAASFKSCAPMFSNLSSSWISLATVTWWRIFSRAARCSRARPTPVGPQ
jgi:hypothetical protein